MRFLVSAISTSSWLMIANEIRIWAGLVAAIAAVAAGIAGYAQIRLQATISKEKDRAFEEFKTTSQAQIAEANRQTAELKKQSIEAQRELERERTERLRLQERVAWRRLKPEQSRKLMETLRGKKFEVILTTAGADPETMQFSADIEDALKAAGLKVETSTSFFTYPIQGLAISSGTTPEIFLLQGAFRGANIPFGLAPPSAKPAITVGSKLPF